MLFRKNVFAWLLFNGYLVTIATANGFVIAFLKVLPICMVKTYPFTSYNVTQTEYVYSATIE